MDKQTNEQALKARKILTLTGITNESLNSAQEPSSQYLKQGDYYIGHRQDYDVA